MGWVEFIEYKLTESCKDFILAKEKIIHGLILSYGQDEFLCWCDYNEKEKLSLHSTDDWTNDSYEEALIDFYMDDFYMDDFYMDDFYMDDLPFDEENDTVNDIGLLMLSIVMTKVVITLRKDKELTPFFSGEPKIGINLGETNLKPTFHGNYFGRYDPNPRQRLCIYSVLN